MDNIRLLLRYAIPGWLAHVFYLTYESLRCTLKIIGSGCMLQDISVNIEPVDLLVLLTIANAVLLGAGIPIGFVIYQTYQAMFHRLNLGTLFGRNRIFSATARLDRGAYVLQHLTASTRRAIAKEIGLVRSNADHSDPSLVGHVVRERRIWRLPGLLGFRVYEWTHERYVLPGTPAVDAMADHSHSAEGCPEALRSQILMNWATATYVWFRVVTRVGLDLVESRAAGLSDVFHSLGAARIAVLTSWLVVLAVAVRSGRLQRSEGEAVALGSAFILGLVAIWIFNLARTSTHYSLMDLYRNFITAYAEGVFAEGPLLPPLERARRPDAV